MAEAEALPFANASFDSVLSNVGVMFTPDHARLAAHWVQVFRDFCGPTHKAFAALDEAGPQALERDITALMAEMNTAGAASLVTPAEYLEVMITKTGGYGTMKWAGMWAVGAGQRLT